MFVLMCPHKKKSNGVKSGERGAHEIGPPLPIHRSSNLLSSHERMAFEEQDHYAICLINDIPPEVVRVEDNYLFLELWK